MADITSVPDMAAGIGGMGGIASGIPGGDWITSLPDTIMAYANGASSMDQLEVMGLVCIGFALVNIFLAFASIAENEAYIRRMSR